MRSLALMTLLTALVCIGLWRGIGDAGYWAISAYQGYGGPMNSVRVAKSIIYVLLLLPLLREEIQRDPTRATRSLRTGMLTGSSLVVLAVLWERAAYVGLADFSAPYRTTALFWEMHVGGAAIDGYLALATPFVAWALHRARTPARWAAAALLALLTGHAALTTFSRGVYLAIGAPLLLLAVLLWGRRGDVQARRELLHKAGVAVVTILLAVTAVWGSAAFGYVGPAVALALIGAWWARRVRAIGWRLAAARVLAVLLAMEVAVVLVSGSFMNSRIAAADHDLASRIEHWRNGIDLLQSPAEWLFGLGWGRLPANYARFVPDGEFSGETSLLNLGGGHQAAARISGPRTLRTLAGQYALTQRISLGQEGLYRSRLEVRSEAHATLAVSACEMHLLYERRCQIAEVRVQPGPTEWQTLEVVLSGPQLTSGDWFAPRRGVFLVTVLNAGAAVEIRHASLRTAADRELLVNGDFASGFAHWFPVAQNYFIPWHIDNLYVEILIDAGLSGLLVFASLIGWVLHGLLRGSARDDPAAPFLAASLCGALSVGLVGSLMDMPRVAFLMLLLIAFSLLLGRGRPVL